MRIKMFDIHDHDQEYPIYVIKIDKDGYLTNQGHYFFYELTKPKPKKHENSKEN